MSVTPYFPHMIAELNMHNDAHIEVRSPYDQALLATVETVSEKEIDHALAIASKLYQDRSTWLAISERLAILERAITLMEEQSEVLATHSAHEGGKPLIDSRVEITRCIDSFKLCVEVLRTDTPKPVPMGLNSASQHRLTMMKKEPIGVVVAVSAFNHPLNLIAHQIGPAIASGCPVIVKPADDTPLSCYRLVNILRKAGLPEQWCQVVSPKDHDTAEQLVTDPRVAFFSFIGSARVGWYLRSKLAAGTRCALEHGGVAPVIMAADSDLDKAIPGLSKGAFYHAGQVCVSVQRIFAHESIAQDVAQRLSDAAQKLIVGDPLSDQTEVGPLIRAAEGERIASWVDEAVKEGAELLCGGHSLPNNSYSPTVLYNPSLESKVSHSEIFGPVVCIYSYTDVAQAISIANSLDVAFQASVYSQDIDTAMAISDQLSASAVMINEHTAFRVDWMPFAGLKHSGLGTGGIPYTMEDMQVDKMIVISSAGIQ